MRLRHLLPLLATSALTLTACGTSTEPAAETTSTITTPTPGLTPDDLTDQTDLVFTITWAQADEPDKDELCAALALYGPEFAATAMQNGADGSTELDWARMADLLGDECDAR